MKGTSNGSQQTSASSCAPSTRWPLRGSSGRSGHGRGTWKSGWRALASSISRAVLTRAEFEQITAFLAGQAPALRALGPPVLIHADLTAEHVMLVEERGRWRLSGVLDLADAMTAAAELDLVAPFVELFRGRRGPQRRLMAEAGVSRPAGSFAALFMAVALQHRFMHFDDWFAPEIAASVTDVADVARRAFPD